MEDSWLRLLLEEEEKKDPLQDYALYIDAGRHSSDYVLYKPKYYAQRMKNEIEKAKEEFNRIRFKGQQFSKFKDFYAFSNVKDIFRDPKGVYGFMSINNGRIIGMRGSCNRANEIRSIAAREGFGRLMFMLALANESPVMPNRQEISKSAYNYWDKLSVNPNIKKDAFDNELRLAQKEPSDCRVYGDRVIDQSFKPESDMENDLRPLLERHKIFLNQMKVYFEKSGVDYILSRIKEYIAEAGSHFFDERRGEKEWYETLDMD